MMRVILKHVDAGQAQAGWRARRGRMLGLTEPFTFTFGPVQQLAGSPSRDIFLLLTTTTG